MMMEDRLPMRGPAGKRLAMDAKVDVVGGTQDNVCVRGGEREWFGLGGFGWHLVFDVGRRGLRQRYLMTYVYPSNRAP